MPPHKKKQVHIVTPMSSAKVLEEKKRGWPSEPHSPASRRPEHSIQKADKQADVSTGTAVQRKLSEAATVWNIKSQNVHF